MTSFNLHPSALAGLFVLALVFGCRGESTDSTTTPAAGTGDAAHAASGDDHGHDHDGHDHDGHDHDHAHMGTHGGHVVVLEPGHIHAEWVHVEEDDVLEVYVLDHPEEVQSVKFVTQIAGQEPVEYALEAAEQDLGKGGYQLKDPNLLTAVEMADGEATTATLVVETESGTIKASITDDHDHDHAH